jgi:hypothetical protein
MAGVFKSLDKSDVRITPFRTYKLWSDVIENNLSGSVYTVYQANYNPQSNYLQVDPLKDTFDQDNAHFEQFELTTANGKFQRVVHRSAEHLYYRDFYTNNKASFGSGNINTQLRYLEDQAQIVSMPQSRFGEAILPGSVQMNMSWSYAVNSGSLYNTSSVTTASGVWVVEDDFHGNLVISGSGFYSPYGQYVGGAYTNYTSSITKTPVGEWPLDTIYKYTDIGAVSFTSSFNKGDWQMETIYNNISVSFPTSSTYPSASATELLGAQMKFTSANSSSLIVKTDLVSDYKDLYNFQSKPFSVSMFLKPMAYPTQASGAVLLSKHGPAEELQIDINGNVFSQPVNNQFPYRLIYTSGSRKIAFQQGGGHQGIFSVTSSVALDVDTLYHVVATKSGSVVSVYVNSAVSSSQNSATSSLNDNDCINLANTYIGNSYKQTEGFDGYIDNIKIYNKLLNQTEINILHHTLGVGSVNVGNVFYNHGMMSLTSIPSRYATFNTIETRGTHTIWETEISCTIGPGEFTRSTNPSLQVYDPNQNQYVFSSFATSSDFSPFVTSVGLYDDYHRLVAIGKLSAPIQLPNNTDTTIIVRFDR